MKQKLLEFDNVDLKFTKQYIGLVFEQKNSCSIILRKTKIDVIINRGIEYTDGTKSKTFFELDDPKSISKPLSWTWKNGTKGHTYSINYDNNSDLDYIIFLNQTEIRFNPKTIPFILTPISKSLYSPDSINNWNNGILSNLLIL